MLPAPGRLLACALAGLAGGAALRGLGFVSWPGHVGVIGALAASLTIMTIDALKLPGAQLKRTLLCLGITLLCVYFGQLLPSPS